MKSRIISIVFILSIEISYAQNNLIPNGSFENNTICPSHLSNAINDGKVFYCSNPNGGTPNYFNSCTNVPSQAYQVPSNYLGFQIPRTGNAYIGLDIWDKGYVVSEYIQIKLAENLKQNHHYGFECFLSKAEMARYGTTNFGVYFSVDSIHHGPFEILPLVPQIINSQTNYLIDTVNWIPFTGTYLAQGGERFIVMGNFNDSMQSVDTVFQYYGSVNHHDAAYYYIDDVSLIDLDSTLAIQENDALANKLNIFPNPGSKIITLSECNLSDVINIYDITGKQVYQAILNESKQINIENLEVGIYIIKVQSNKEMQVGRFVKD